MRWFALLLVLMLGAGCAGTLRDSVDYGGLRVERGMSIDEVQAVLGEPQLVYHWRDQLHFVDKFWKLRIGMSGASEWAWLRPDPAVIVWTHEGRVTSIGTLPREVAEGVPRPPVWPPYEELRHGQGNGWGQLLFGILQLLLPR